MTVKEQVMDAVKELPSDVSFENVMERLYLLYKIRRGIAQADAGETISNEEAKERMSKWVVWVGELHTRCDCRSCPVGAGPRACPPMSDHHIRHPRHVSQLERAGLRPDNYTHNSDDVCWGRHRPALAEAMQDGYHYSNPHLQMGDLGSPTSSFLLSR